LHYHPATSCEDKEKEKVVFELVGSHKRSVLKSLRSTRNWLVIHGDETIGGLI
jgi:hypothetical protein